MQSSSLLLGRPWEFDTDAAHHGRTNTYTLMHKDKKITLLPLSPADIRKHFKGLAENVSIESSDAKPNGIKLKEGVYIATTSATVTPGLQKDINRAIIYVPGSSHMYIQQNE